MINDKYFSLPTLTLDLLVVTGYELIYQVTISSPGVLYIYSHPSTCVSLVWMHLFLYDNHGLISFPLYLQKIL